MNKSLRVGILDPVGIKAGMNNYDLGLATGLHRAGINVNIYSNFDANLKGIKVYNCFESKKTSRLLMLLQFIFSHLVSLIRAKKYLTEYMVLHIFSAGAKDILEFILVKLFKINIIAIVHDVESFSNEDSGKFRNKMYDWSDYLVVHNQFSKDVLSKYVSESIERKIHVIKHGNFLDFISKNVPVNNIPELEKLSLSDKKLLFFGQIKKVKGLDILLNSLSNLPSHIKLIIAGRPHKDDMIHYNEIIDKQGISEQVIKVIRFIEDSEREFLFNYCDATVLPYKKIFQSGVLLLAMSHGSVVIASDLEPNKEVITNMKDGILFETENSIDLAKKILELFENKKIKSKISEQAILTMKSHYNWDIIGKDYIKMLDLE